MTHFDKNSWGLYQRRLHCIWFRFVFTAIRLYFLTISVQIFIHIFATQCNTIIEFIEISKYLQYRLNNNEKYRNVKKLNHTAKYTFLIRHTFNYIWRIREKSGIILLSLTNLRIMKLFFVFSLLWSTTSISYGNSQISWWMESTINPWVEIRFIDDDRCSESQLDRLRSGFYGKTITGTSRNLMSETYLLKVYQL